MNRNSFICTLSFLIAVAFINILPEICSAQESDLKAKKPLSSYLEQALANNDSLQAMRAKLRAISYKIPQTGVLPDPKLAVQYYLEPIETRTGPQQAALGITQGLPWFGKLALLRKLADHDLAIAGAELAATELDVARQVKETYIAYSFLGRSQRIFTDNLELLQYLEGIARDRYTGGKATYFDVLKVQTELAQTREKVRTLQDKTSSLRVQLNNLLGTDPELARPIPDTVPELALKKKEHVIYKLALEHSPLLTAAQERIAKTQTGTALAEKDFFPDFQVSLKTLFTGSAEYGNPPDSGSDPIIAGVSMNIPLFRERRHAKVAEQKEALQSAKALQDEQERGIQNRIEQALYTYRDAKHRVSLYREELLPKVRQQLEVAVSGFQSGKNSILEIIDAEKSLLEFELAESRALTDKAIALAKLEAQAGIILADWRR
ncbi:MAG: TolC family protein [Candidatus Electrothrix aestuarii]|uniref:TolC family protein n=1 Tax=Candidatus Electrothrix aestuarii TaxID=3062594 RepID=A0AAU8LXS3_9BACT|nr:TolC family protein [Candidatus Electrothrix aestuarii]